MNRKLVPLHVTGPESMIVAPTDFERQQLEQCLRSIRTPVIIKWKKFVKIILQKTDPARRFRASDYYVRITVRWGRKIYIPLEERIHVTLKEYTERKRWKLHEVYVGYTAVLQERHPKSWKQFLARRGKQD